MVEIGLSIMVLGAEKGVPEFRQLLDEFEKERHIRVRLSTFTWDSGWEKIKAITLQSRGPDVSEVGSTWVTSLGAMSALRPFSIFEVNHLGGKDAYSPAIWQSCQIQGEPSIWAIPWLADTRLLYYHKEQLSKAGVENIPAKFQNHQSLENVLQKTQEQGFDLPISLIVQNDFNVIFEVAHWIWGAGGAFISGDGKKMSIDSTAGKSGLHSYFSLRKFLHKIDPSVYNPIVPFFAGQCQFAILGPSEMDFSHLAEQKLAVSVPPGVPFVGGSHLVVWRHTRYADAALQLVEYLTSLPSQFPYTPHNGLLPASLNRLEELRAVNPFLETCFQAISTGRCLPNVNLWNVIADRLTPVFCAIWADALAQPQSDIDEIIDRHLDPAVRRLNMMLQG